MEPVKACEWCKILIPETTNYVITGFSYEMICIQCANAADDMGYDVGEM